MNTQTTESIREVYSRGTQVICEGIGEGVFRSFEGRVAAAQDNIIHIHLFKSSNADLIASINGSVSLHRVTPTNRYTSEAIRIENAVPGGITLKIVHGPIKSERREFLRIRCQLPFRWKPTDKDALIGLGEVQAPISETRLHLERLADEIKDKQLSTALLAIFERLNRLEDKVDRLMESAQDSDMLAEDVIIELSGGGMRFLSQRRLRQGDIIDATLCFEQQNTKRDVHLQARVLRIHPPNLGRSQPAVACQFITIHPRDREAIIRYIFRVQREMLRRTV